MNKQNSRWLNLTSNIVLFALFLNSFVLPCVSQKQFVSNTKLGDFKELESLFDPIFAERMDKLHIPGAVISIVSDGKIIFTKGYGVADY
jgi:CubicO group peptidase (beta-lactamase class C family)